MGRPFARWIIVSVALTVRQVEPSPGDEVRQMAVLVKGTCFLG